MSMYTCLLLAWRVQACVNGASTVEIASSRGLLKMDVQSEARRSHTFSSFGRSGQVACTRRSYRQERSDQARKIHALERRERIRTFSEQVGTLDSSAVNKGSFAIASGA